MDLDDFMRRCYPALPAANTLERPVMLSIDAGDVLGDMAENEMHGFVIGLGGILSKCFNLPADGAGGMNEVVAFAVSGSPMMFGEALPDENDAKIDEAQSAIRQAQKLGRLPKEASIFLTLAIR